MNIRNLMHHLPTFWFGGSLISIFALLSICLLCEKLIVLPKTFFFFALLGRRESRLFSADSLIV
jgi:hypothetical protein